MNSLYPKKKIECKNIILISQNENTHCIKWNTKIVRTFCLLSHEPVQIKEKLSVFFVPYFFAQIIDLVLYYFCFHIF